MLKHQSFQNIPTLAFRHPMVGAPGVGFHGGPVIQDAAWQELRHTRYFQPVDWFDGHEATSEPLLGEYVYLGPVYEHFGHFMSEMVHRLLPAMPHLAGRKLLLISTVAEQPQPFGSLPAFCQDVYRFFSVDPDRVVIQTQDRVVEQLHVFQQGSDFGGGPKPGYLDSLAAFSDRLLWRQPASPAKRAKVYVSRSALPGGGGFLGERYVEHVLEEQGFTIARPETMTLIDQMQLYRQAEVIVFPEGSACHGVELLGAGSLGTVIFLARRLDHMEIFRRVLAPRSRTYLTLDPPPGTGSILSAKQHNTVGLIDFAGLFGLLRQGGFCGDIRFDVAKYVETGEADFARHVAHFLATELASIDGTALLERTSAFAEAFRRLRQGAGKEP